MRARDGLRQAFDEARFGARRTLNVREPMLSGAEAARRAEGWLRAKQVERAGDVLVITGRGKGSPGQVGVVREEVRKLLARLRRAGVVNKVEEHTAGSFAVSLAPLRALFNAPRRIRDGSRGQQYRTHRRAPGTLDGLSDDTLALLRRLATASLNSLGLEDPEDDFVDAEMEREFALLSRASSGSLDESTLRSAITHAIREFEEQDDRGRR